MKMSNEEFLKMIEENYEVDFDWSSVPDPETLPDIYEVKGKIKRETGKIETFTVDCEYETLKEAEKQVERCKSWKYEVFEVVVTSTKPRRAITDWTFKTILEDIKKGKPIIFEGP